jgi:hypothetical protein
MSKLCRKPVLTSFLTSWGDGIFICVCAADGGGGLQLLWSFYN